MTFPGIFLDCLLIVVAVGRGGLPPKGINNTRLERKPNPSNDYDTRRLENYNKALAG